MIIKKFKGKIDIIKPKIRILKSKNKNLNKLFMLLKKKIIITNKKKKIPINNSYKKKMKKYLSKKREI
jgi:hypothetical protein